MRDTFHMIYHPRLHVSNPFDLPDLKKLTFFESHYAEFRTSCQSTFSWLTILLAWAIGICQALPPYTFATQRPVLMHWSYIFLALTLRYRLFYLLFSTWLDYCIPQRYFWFTVQNDDLHCNVLIGLWKCLIITQKVLFDFSTVMYDGFRILWQLLQIPICNYI